jgi:type VI protein secretion system component VasK
VTLLVNGQELVDRLARRKETFAWSSDDQETDCSLTLTHTAESKRIGQIEETGDIWSWFRLVDQGKAGKGSGPIPIVWTFDEAGVEVEFLITMRNGECPFAKGSTFRNFGRQLPPAVVQ